MYQPEKIIIADDHPLFRQALKLMLEAHFDNVKVFEVENVSELEALLPKEQDVDLLLLDLNIPGAQGFNTLINMRDKYPQMGVSIVSGYEDKETINKAVAFGSAGFIPKSISIPAMIQAIESILSGEVWLPNFEELKEEVPLSEESKKIASLSPQQYKILMMFSNGLLNKQIAAQLSLSEATVKSHAGAIFLKLGVRNRTQAVIMLNESENKLQSFAQAFE